MTKTQELLEAIKKTLGDVTDSKLASTLGIHRQAIKRMREGNQQADAYAAIRIAMALNKDPLEVIASIEAESASTVAKRAFWASFRSGLTITLCGGALLLTGSFIGPGQTGTANADGTPGFGPVRIMEDLVKRLWRRFKKMQKAPEGAFFSAGGNDMASGSA